MQANGNMAGRHGLALLFVGHGQHQLDHGNAGLDRLTGAAGLLHHQCLQLVAGLQILRGEQAADLTAFATKANDQRGGNIGMADIACQGAVQQIHGLTGQFHAAARAVAEGGNAIDVGKFGQQFLGEMVCNRMHYRGRAIHCRDDGNEVAGAGTAIFPQIALEGCPLAFGQHLNRFVVAAESVVAVEFPKSHVMAVQHGAGG